jgi:peptidoglycan/xylan/chitin deacetylase (PgdA/CDA1 family)
LIYHEISSTQHKWALGRRVLEHHIELLKRSGCSFVSMDQVAGAMNRSIELPRRSVCIHFDDARSGFYKEALSVLREHVVPATLYVVSTWPDGQAAIPEAERYSSFMTWPEIREAAASDLIEIGCHGRSHVNLKRLGRRELVREVSESKAAIEDKIGRSVVHFAAAYNKVDERVRRAVRRAGYRTLCVGGGTPNRWLVTPFRLRRVLVRADVTDRRLAELVSGPSSLP